MIKKLIFTFIVLIAILVVSLKLEQEKNVKETVMENTATIQVSEILLTLEQEGLSSIVVLAHNDKVSVRKADKLIADLSADQKIKVLAFEIYTQDTSPERLMEIAFANGEPDIFYVNGKLVEPRTIADYVRSTLEQPLKK